MVSSCLILYKKFLDCFPVWLYHFTFSVATYENFSYPTSWPVLDLVCLFLPSFHGLIRLRYVILVAIMTYPTTTAAGPDPLTHCAGQGSSLYSSTAETPPAANPIVPQQELLLLLIFKLNLF